MQALQELTLYHDVTNPNSRAVVSLILESRVNVKTLEKFEKNGTFLEKSPVGRLPLLQDKDLYLTESYAIMVYLCEAKNLSQYYPQNPKQRALVDRFFSWANTNLYQPIGCLVYNEIMCPKLGRQANTVDVQENLEKMNQICTFLQQDLQKTNNSFIAGQNLTIADFQAFQYFKQVLLIKPKFNLKQWPLLSAWYKAMKKLNGVKQVDTSFKVIKQQLKQKSDSN